MISVLNPFANYLHDSYALLNLALNQHAFARDNTTFLARSSAMHAVGAVQAAAHTCLRSIDYNGHMHPKTLADKFDAYLRDRNKGELDQMEATVLQELEMVGKLLCSPQPAESYDFWRPSDDRVTDFERTPLKKIPGNITHWQPEFSGAVLGMAVSAIKRILLVRCGHCVGEMEKLFGMQLSTPNSHIVAFDEELLDALRTEQDVLVSNADFMQRMQSKRWRMRPSDFQLSLKTKAGKNACAACQKLRKVA